jgi:hypothetical protein
MNKQMSLTSFVLKGTGWYETDFKGATAKKTETESEKTIGDQPAAAAESNPAGATTEKPQVGAAETSSTKSPTPTSPPPATATASSAESKPK